MSDQYIPINDWSEEDRPREKLMLKGRASLSDAELLAILIGSGSRNESAVELCRRILAANHNNLDTLAKLEVKDLTKFKGIGEAKAISIVSALELGRRRQLTRPVDRAKITCSHDAYLHIGPMLCDLPHEEFWILLLNKRLEVTKTVQISQGGVGSTVVDAKIVLKHALEHLAPNIILVHNHPSGTPKPSKADISLTSKLAIAAKTMDISVSDHIIVAGNTYFSFNDEGLL